MTTSTAHLELEIVRLRDENRRLRAALRQNGRYARRIQRAHDAALLLATWHVGHLDTARRACMGRGMAQRQWENAVTLLRLARIVDPAGRWYAHDLPTIVARLDRAAVAAGESPDSYFARGPRHMRKRRRQRGATAPAEA